MANFIQKIFQTEKRSIGDESVWQNPILGTFSFNSFSKFNSNKALKLSVVNRCINLISDSIAALPLLPYVYKNNWKIVDEENSINNLLNLQPNNFSSAFTFKKQMIENMLLKGNSYILIERENNGDVISLKLLNSDYIQIQVNGALVSDVLDITDENFDLKYFNLLSGKIYDKSQIIHLINYTSNGIAGISTLAYAADALGLAHYTNEHSSNFFKGGANLAGILKPVAGMNLLKGQGIKAKQDFINALNPSLGGTSGGVVVLDSGLEYQSITVNPKDSQMIENKAFSVLEICRYFGVPPSLAFSETSKYSTAEQQALDFMNNCLLPILEKTENEFRRKLYLKSEWNYNDLKFDVENLIRLDATTKIDVMTKRIANGLLTVNEGRENYNCKFPVSGGNEAFISTNLQSLKNPVVTSQPEKTKDNFIDNKLK